MASAVSEEDTSDYPTRWERPSVFYNDAVKWLVYLGIIAFLLWSAWAVRVSPERIVGGLEAGAGIVTDMFPPNFGPRQRSLIFEGMVESIAMSIVATFIGVLISIPIAVMAAENLVPKPVYYVGRSIVSISRALHELVIGIITVVAVGVGPLAGVIALVFATPGFFAKLLAEDLEDVDETQIDAIRAVGGSSIHVLAYSVLPQVIPRMVGLAVYRWDINIRAATIIGIVGAGGIGVTLLNSFERYEYDFTLAIIIVIIGVVIVGEVISELIRRRVQ